MYMNTVIEFDHEKATQALNFLARKEGGSISKLKAVKLVWLADRYHLRKYGRPITNDTYYAMKLGPVGSSVKDLAERSDFLASEEKAYFDRFLNCNREGNQVSSKMEVDNDVFSETDLEALEQVYHVFGGEAPFALVNLSHDFPEWSKFRSQLQDGGGTREVMSYSDFFQDPIEQRSDAPFYESKERLRASKQTFEENYKIANFWMG